MRYKIILISIWASIALASCHHKKIEVTATNKYIAIYDRLDDKPGYKHSYGYVFEITNNMSNKLIFDTIVINHRNGFNDDVYDLLEEERPLSRMFIQNDAGCRFLTDTLEILPGNKIKIMIYVNDFFKSIPDAKKLLKVCWIDDISFYFHTNQDTVVIKKNTKSIHKLLNDKILYYIDNKLIDNKVINEKYINLTFKLN